MLLNTTDICSLVHIISFLSLYIKYSCEMPVHILGFLLHDWMQCDQMAWTRHSVSLLLTLPSTSPNTHPHPTVLLASSTDTFTSRLPPPLSVSILLAAKPTLAVLIWVWRVISFVVGFFYLMNSSWRFNSWGGLTKHACAVCRGDLRLQDPRAERAVRGGGIG